MKIVFWSNVRGQCGTTMHLTCMAVIQAIFEQQRVVLMENHDHVVSIETCLTKGNHEHFIMEGSGGYEVFGLERLIGNITDLPPGSEEAWIRRCAIPFVGGKLFYLPHGDLKNRDLLDYEFCRNFNQLFNSLENYFDTVYIDTFATECLSTQAILDSADIIVVNLNQNNNVLNHFFRNFTSLHRKAIYLLGNYYLGNYNSVLDIRRKYQVPENRIFAIPYCREAAVAESDGSLANFITRNYEEPSIDNREFIEAIKMAYNGIRSYSLSMEQSSRGFSFI